MNETTIPIIDIHPDNIGQEHICCAITDKKSVSGYAEKKEWLSSQYGNGYRFKRLDARGKIFIEYVPAEHAWLPIDAANHMVINCFWVSGKFKKKGNGKRLLQTCIDDAIALDLDGIVAVAGDKKRPFMSDPKFFQKQGFEAVDEAPPFFKLWWKKLKSEATPPQFKPTAKAGRLINSVGIEAFYSATCPFTDYWTNQLLRQYAEEKGIPCQIHKLTTQADGHAMPIPWIINSVFYNGELVSLELKVSPELDKLINEEKRDTEQR